MPDPLAYPLVLAIPALLFLSAAYALFAPRLPDEKARAYVLSAITSATMTLASVPYVALYLTGGLPAVWAAGHAEPLRALGEGVCVFFGVYLFADLTIGYVFYRSQIGLLTGWIHHISYIAIMAHLVSSGEHPVFCLGAIMELPTFDLAASHLWPAVRDDARFLSLMFATRIAFHLVLLVDCARPASVRLMHGSRVPTAVLALAFALHAAWFRGGLAGHLRRRRAIARRAADAAVKDQPALAAADAADPTAPAQSLTAEAAAAAAVDDDDDDDDSPIVTPFTPSQTPLSIRDSYLFPSHLIPSLPGMPALADLAGAKVGVPKVPNLAGLNSAFKDAVRGKWEERTRDFAARGMGLGALGLRRRKGDAARPGADDVCVRVEEVAE